MDFFLPSDIARVVLSYLRDNSYYKTYTCFMKECSLLQEYYALIKMGRNPQLTHLPQLTLLLDEWGRLKQKEKSSRDSYCSQLSTGSSPDGTLVGDNDVTKSQRKSPLKKNRTLSGGKKVQPGSSDKCNNRAETQICQLDRGDQKTTNHSPRKHEAHFTLPKKVLFSPKRPSVSSGTSSSKRSPEKRNSDCKKSDSSLSVRLQSCTPAKSYETSGADSCPSKTSASPHDNVNTRSSLNVSVKDSPTVNDVNLLRTSNHTVKVDAHDDVSKDSKQVSKDVKRDTSPVKSSRRVENNDSTKTVIATPEKSDTHRVLLDSHMVTPIKLLMDHEASTRSPRRKKPKTPRKRASDLSPVEASHSIKHIEEQPIFQQILSDTRLHEKIAQTCNSVVTKSVFKKGPVAMETESRSEVKDTEHKLTAEELETITASRSLEEILEIGANFETKVLHEKLDMSDPVYESLFKLFGTDRATFMEGFKKERSEAEMKAEIEELERSIHEIHEECASMAANSPHYLGSQEDLFSPAPSFPLEGIQRQHEGLVTSTPCASSAPINFTPMLRGNELGSSPIHSAGSSGKNLSSTPATQPFSPTGQTTQSSGASQSHSPGYQSENPYLHSNPATPISQDLLHSEPSTPMQLSSPSSNQQLHSTPHGPSSVRLHSHASSPIHPQHATISSKNIPSNCSPLVKADIHPGSPIMRQTNGPHVRKTILQPGDSSQSYFSSYRPKQTTTNTKTISDFHLLNPQDSGYLNLLSDAADLCTVDTASLAPEGSAYTSTCSTIENTIDCISLPRPNTTTVGARAHGQGKGKKGKLRKNGKKGSKKNRSFSTLKSLLSKPQTEMSTQQNVLKPAFVPLQMTPKKLEHAIQSNQSITILSPGGSKIDVPILGCQDAAEQQGNASLAKTDLNNANTINMWNQNLNSCTQYTIMQNGNVITTNATINLVPTVTPVVNQNIENTESGLDANGKKKRGRKKKSDDSNSPNKNQNPQSQGTKNSPNGNISQSKEFEFDMSEKLIATPITHNNVFDRAHVRSLDFGPLAIQDNLGSFRKICPKPREQVTPQVIIVHASNLMPATCQQNFTPTNAISSTKAISQLGSIKPMETGDNAEAVDPEETNLNKTELIVERDGEKEKNNPSEKAEYGTDEKQDNNEDDEMSPSSRNLRSVKKPDIKKIENSANSKDTTTFKPKLVVSKAKKVTKSIKNRKSEDRLLVKLPVHNKDSTETDKSRSPKKRSLNLFKKKSELDQSSSPQDDDVPLATLQKKIRADSHCDTKDDEEESLIPVVEPCTPKKASPEKVEFTPSKEEMLEKVGLTPTKSLSETVLSPRRASIQEMLHDWQKKITPNTRSKQKKLEELMKSPLTPPRRRSLFKSPTKNTENLDRKGIENDEKSNCKASEYEEKPNAGKTAQKTAKRVNSIIDKLYRHNPSMVLGTNNEEIIDTEHKTDPKKKVNRKKNSCSVSSEKPVVKEIEIKDEMKDVTVKEVNNKVSTEVKAKHVHFTDDYSETQSEQQTLYVKLFGYESENEENIEVPDREELEKSISNLVDIMETESMNPQINDAEYENNTNLDCLTVEHSLHNEMIVTAEVHRSADENCDGSALQCVRVPGEDENSEHSMNKQEPNDQILTHLESEDPLPPSVAVPQSDQHVDIEQRPSDIAPVLTCRVDVTDTTVEKSSTHKKKKKHKHKHRHERSKDKGSKENDSENGDVKKPKERHSADGSVTSGGSHHKKHKHKHRHREKTGEDGHKHKHRDSGEHRHSHKKKKRKREESPGVEAKRPKLEGDISQESLADLNVDEVLSKLYNS
ncbi:uncharacterized protein LOC128236382 [Mya arenaria]|uniref:uncharacterized protein LOC128236382 n=1 Tax=Mya arenaria TaxID=6604 RepID=UPI0022E55D12|nr:uncharacterized protein LOC128236382 [Mya arenaria]